MFVADAQIVDAKYVFLDIVGFTRDRDVEAQAECVEKLNTVVKLALDEVVKVAEDDCILLHTGDGMCIVLLGSGSPFDLHMQVALAILANLEANNQGTEEEMLRFEVRIGINENADNLITDINGRQNVAGSGINVAQRVMDSADGNQIVLSTRVHENLRERRDYRGWFRSYRATTKHGERVPVYQFVKDGQPGLNLDIPGDFKKVVKQRPKLPEWVAYYLAHAIRNRPVLVANRERIYDDAVVVLLRYLALDSQQASGSSELDDPRSLTFGAGNLSFWEQYEYYAAQDYDVVSDLGRFIEYGNRQPISEYEECFAEDSFGLPDYRAANEHGKRKLKEEWPNIWDEFNLDNVDGDGST